MDDLLATIQAQYDRKLEQKKIRKRLVAGAKEICAHVQKIVEIDEKCFLWVTNESTQVYSKKEPLGYHVVHFSRFIPPCMRSNYGSDSFRLLPNHAYYNDFCHVLWQEGVTN